jgi:hypothetical protein
VHGGVEAVEARREIERRDLEQNARLPDELLGAQPVALGVDAEHRAARDGRDGDAEHEVGKGLPGARPHFDLRRLPRTYPAGLAPLAVAEDDRLEHGLARADALFGACGRPAGEPGLTFLLGYAFPVERDRPGRGPVGRHATVIEPDRPAAPRRDQSEVVRDEDEGLAGPFELRELLETPMGERLVAHGQYLVDEQHVRVAVRGDRKAQANRHAGGVGLHRGVEEFLDPGEPHDLIEARGDLAAGEAEQQTADLQVLATGDFGVKPRPELEQRRQAARHADMPGRRTHDPREQLQQRRLAGAIGSDDTDGLAGGDGEGNLRQGGHRGVGRQGAPAFPGKQGRLERSDRALAPVSPVKLRDALRTDGDGSARLPLRPSRRLPAVAIQAHASSATESRSRSKIAPPTARLTTDAAAIATQSAAATGRKKKAVS